MVPDGDVPPAKAQLSRFVRGAVCFGLLLMSLSYVACAPGSLGQALDEAAAPGTNYDKAEFRLW
jgi:hypothetical protein